MVISSFYQGVLFGFACLFFVALMNKLGLWKPIKRMIRTDVRDIDLKKLKRRLDRAFSDNYMRNIQVRVAYLAYSNEIIVYYRFNWHEEYDQFIHDVIWDVEDRFYAKYGAILRCCEEGENVNGEG